MEVKYLWAQEALRMKRFEGEVPGTKNPSDVLTKPQGAGAMQEKLEKVRATLIRRTGHGPSVTRASWADLTEEEFGESVS